LPVGQVITLISGKTKSDYVITGVFKKPKDNTQLAFDMVKLANESDSYAYLLLKQNTDPADLEKYLIRKKRRFQA